MGCTESVPVVENYNRNQQQNYNNQPYYNQNYPTQNYQTQNYQTQNNTKPITNNSEDPVNLEKTNQYTYAQTNQPIQQNYVYPQQNQQYVYQQQYYTNPQQMPYQQYNVYPQQNVYQQQRTNYVPNQQQNQPSLLGTVGAVAGGVILGDMISDALFD